MNHECRMKNEELKNTATLQAGFVSAFCLLPSAFSSNEHHLSGSHPRSAGRALRDDPRVIYLRAGRGRFGGAFKATKNLGRNFPPRARCAISEDAMIGLRSRGD